MRQIQRPVDKGQGVDYGLRPENENKGKGGKYIRPIFKFKVANGIQ